MAMSLVSGLILFTRFPKATTQDALLKLKGCPLWNITPKISACFCLSNAQQYTSS